VDGLGGIFFFATLCALMKWQESESGRWLAASVALYGCAVFTKETMVVIPVLIAFYLFVSTPVVGRFFRTMWALVPFGIVSMVYLAIRHQVIKPPSTAAEYLHPVYTFNNLWTAPYAAWWYIRHLVMPWGLGVEYQANVLNRPTLAGFVLPGIGLLALAAVSLWLWSRQRSKTAGFLIFWFAITLGPPVILAPMVSEHDRYVYIPSYAFCALVAWVLLYLGKVEGKARFVAALAVVALFSGLTWHEMGYWDCDTTLWSRVLEISPTEPRARLQLASIYSGEMNVPKALDVLNEGLRYHPNSVKLWRARGEIHHSNRQLDEARGDYLKIMQLTDPETGQALESGLVVNMRGNAANRLADLDISANNFAEAEQYARMALNLDPRGVGYHSTLARALAGEGRTPEAGAESAMELHLRVAQRR
jgi:tetratricopeptide (TPR) repeat protein